MAYNYFVTNVNTIVRSMESAAHVVLEALGDDGDAGGTRGPDIAPATPELRTAPAGAQ